LATKQDYWLPADKDLVVEESAFLQGVTLLENGTFVSKKGAPVFIGPV
jgi:hypothetical protein